MCCEIYAKFTRNQLLLGSLLALPSRRRRRPPSRVNSSHVAHQACHGHVRAYTASSSWLSRRMFMWDRSRRPEEGEWEPIKISSEIQTAGLYPENHPSPQAFWPKFGIAMEKLNQHKRPRTSERNHEANRKRIEKTAELIVHRIGLTGLSSSRTSRPV